MKNILIMLVFMCSPIVGMAIGERVSVSNPANRNNSSKYINPVIDADYSDPDAVAKPDGSGFYLTASSFQCTPGLPILFSPDLVNWEIVNYALPEVPPRDFYGSGIPRHGKGVWAPCIKYHDGEYYIYWGDPDFGIFMIKTSDPEGQWSEPVLVKAGKGLIDPSPFWDEDGKAYLANGWAASRAGFNSIITISEMSPDGTRVTSAPRIVYDGNDGVNHTVEGPKMYRRGDYYYLFAPAGGVAEGWQLIMRSKNVFGPYESKIVMNQGKTDINGPHQGAWVTDADGKDWFLHFQDKGPYGRVLHLNPLEWKEDWPVIGIDSDGDGCGNPVSSYQRPCSGSKVAFSDKEEDKSALFQWHSNYSDFFGFPLADGMMRLYSLPLSDAGSNLWEIPNLWLMKFPGQEFEFTADLKIAAKETSEGVSSGIVVMGWDYCRFGLVKRGDRFTLQLVSCTDAETGGRENVTDICDIKPSRKYSAGLISNIECDIFLRVKVDKNAVCRFSYSTDGKKFKTLKQEFKARAGKWIGAKVGFYSIMPPEVSEKGWIDVKDIEVK